MITHGQYSAQSCKNLTISYIDVTTIDQQKYKSTVFLRFADRASQYIYLSN